MLDICKIKGSAEGMSRGKFSKSAVPRKLVGSEVKASTEEGPVERLAAGCCNRLN